MPINHFSSQLPPPNWWPQPQQQNHELMDSHSQNSSSSNTITFWPTPQFFTPHNPSLDFDLNNEEESEIDHRHLSDQKNSIKQIEEEEEEGCVVEIPKEPLFEKPLTPSDVGKLNRLVIPKQHAEKYFPLNGVNESGEKGLLLSFEDELGKPWRFRYSYWNSSQSYVLTKGWSRFVKEKKLDAGDVVQFERHKVDGERFFIGWRRRRGLESSQAAVTVATAGGGGGGGWTRVLLSGQPYPGQQTHHHGPALPYPPDYFHAGGGGGGVQRGTTESGNCKRVRLFGVNLECQPEAPAPSDDSGSSASSNQGPDPPNHQNPYHQYYPQFHANFNHPTHVDVNFPRDMSHSRYQQG